jgi:hypothetical protein
MAKADYAMSKIYVRHARYATFYPARSSYAAIVPDIRKHQ